MADKVELLNKPSTVMDKAIAAKAGGLKVMTAPTAMSMKVELEIDGKVNKELGKDPLLYQQMRDACEAVYNDLVDRIGENLKSTDKGAMTLREQGNEDKLKKLVEVVNKNIVGARDVAIERAEKDALKCWSDLLKTRKEYTKYKVKIVAKIGLGLAGLAVSLGLLAGGVVSFGASSIPGIVGMVKTLAVIGAEVKSASEEIETAQGRLDKNLKEIEKKFVNAKGEFTKRGKAQEIGVTLAAQFFGATGPFAVVPNIKECASGLEVVKNKLGGLKVRTHDAAKELAKILEAITKAKKKFMEDVDKALGKSPNKKVDYKKIEDRMTQEVDARFASKVQAALEAVIAFDNRFKTAEPKVKFAEKRVAELVKLKGVGWKIFENTLVFSDVALSFADPSQYAKLSETLGGLLPAVGGLAGDKLTKVIFEGTALE